MRVKRVIGCEGETMDAVTAVRGRGGSQRFQRLGRICELSVVQKARGGDAPHIQPGYNTTEHDNNDININFSATTQVTRRLIS
jgi:hypothetical protein